MSYTHRTSPLPEQYDTATIEKKWQQHWLATQTYAWDASIPRADSYVIDTPPPTVSGMLHIGHVFSYTQADFIARYQRMTGKNVFYPMGFDDNGLPTERLVEKTKKIRAVDMSREEFINVCMGVSDEARKEFRTLFESIALSVDWKQEYHTISESSRRLSQASFLDLVNKGQCYRAVRPFYWDPVDQTAIAQAEIEDKELPSFANDILFRVIPGSSRTRQRGEANLPPLGHSTLKEIPAQGRDDGQYLTIMTTRPELLPACVALFCHPDDARYTHLHGKQAEVPLFGFTVPILTDDTVEMEKGTGLMMCCTFGDDADIAKQQKHNLPIKIVINKFGKMEFGLSPEAAANETARNAYEMLQGKKVSNTDPKHLGARQTIIAMLEEVGLLTAKKPITHAVKCAERSGAPLEILPSEQWFVKVVDKKAELTARARECNWNPDWMRLRIEQWIEGLNADWCISRQRYFGVPFPVWYEINIDPVDDKPLKAVYASVEQLPVNPLIDCPAGYEEITDLSTLNFRVAGELRNQLYKNPEGKIVRLIPDYDVMDTWATSSISPQLSAGAISGTVIPASVPGSPATSLSPLQEIPGQARDDAENHRFQSLFPADLRPQAHEIIRTWAFYTIVKAHLHNNSVPWHNLMISGWCLAEDKTKMSKSKGNVVTPVALIEDKGADAVRYWAATSRLGQDTAFSPDLLKIGKKLLNKLWNATQFAAIHFSKLTTSPTTAASDTGIGEILDQWVLARLNQTIEKSTKAFDTYEYAEALDATNQFFWADFCDNYLELIKKRIYNEDGSFTSAQQQSAVRAVYYCLDGILKLYAPIVPHVTEELYAAIFADAYAAHGSLHARGMWPRAQDFSRNPLALQFGEISKLLLEDIRKKKSDAKRSIKTPVTEAKVTIGADILRHTQEIESLGRDLCGAGNISSLQWFASAQEGTVATIEATLAIEADAA